MIAEMRDQYPFAGTDPCSRLGQGLNKVLPIHVISVNRLPPIPSAHEVINGTGIFDP